VIRETEKVFELDFEHFLGFISIINGAELVGWFNKPIDAVGTSCLLNEFKPQIISAHVFLECHSFCTSAKISSAHVDDISISKGEMQIQPH
jgi:hypothetical protein